MRPSLIDSKIIHIQFLILEYCLPIEQVYGCHNIMNIMDAKVKLSVTFLKPLDPLIHLFSVVPQWICVLNSLLGGGGGFRGWWKDYCALDSAERCLNEIDNEKSTMYVVRTMHLKSKTGIDSVENITSQCLSVNHQSVYCTVIVTSM